MSEWASVALHKHSHTRRYADSGNLCYWISVCACVFVFVSVCGTHFAMPATFTCTQMWRLFVVEGLHILSEGIYTDGAMLCYGFWAWKSDMVLGFLMVITWEERNESNRGCSYSIFKVGAWNYRVDWIRIERWLCGEKIDFVVSWLFCEKKYTICQPVIIISAIMNLALLSMYLRREATVPDLENSFHFLSQKALQSPKNVSIVTGTFASCKYPKFECNELECVENFKHVLSQTKCL